MQCIDFMLWFEMKIVLMCWKLSLDVREQTNTNTSASITPNDLLSLNRTMLGTTTPRISENCRKIRPPWWESFSLRSFPMKHEMSEDLPTCVEPTTATVITLPGLSSNRFSSNAIAANWESRNFEINYFWGRNVWRYPSIVRTPFLPALLFWVANSNSFSNEKRKYVDKDYTSLANDSHSGSS